MTICCEVNIFHFVVEYVPCCDQQLSGYGNKDFHLVFLPDLSLMIREPAEEAVSGPAGSPCTFNDGPSEEDISVGNVS